MYYVKISNQRVHSVTVPNSRDWLDQYLKMYYMYRFSG